jgi:hypothetical protein
MDRDVTVRFYDILNEDEHERSLEDVIADIENLDKADRERDVSGGIRLRLEHVERDNGLIFGDLTRVQTENLPGHVTDQENDPLPVERIGHPAAFCYDPETGMIALQFDIKIGIGRVCNYFGQFVDNQDFSNLPVLRQDAIDRFSNETPTSFTVKVARVRNFEFAETQLTDFEEGIETIARMFDGNGVEVTVTSKAADGGLDRESTLMALRRWLGFREEIQGINKLKGATVESDDAFNFIKFLLKEKETLDLPNNDPLDGRARRIRYVRRVYGQHRGYLRAVAGVA